MKQILDSSFIKSGRWIDLFFYFFVLLVLSTRVLLFLELNLDHIDSDQPIMWLGTAHFSEGLFYEPRYYGQNYNTMMEGLLAVPLIKLGMPVYYAVPVITYLLFLSPFLFTSFYLFARNKKPQALMVLILLLCMPIGYDMMNAIPRGFVTGIFFTTPFILSILDPGRLKFIFLNTFCAGIAYLVNQNSLLVSLPFLFYLLLCNYASRKYYLSSIAAVIAVLPIAYLLDHFYTVHPEYIQHDFKQTFSLSYFVTAISSLDKRFAHIDLFADEKCIYTLIFLLLTGTLLFKANKKAFYAYLFFLMILLASFFSSKTGDGAVWPYYSYSRMYLGILPVLYLFLSLFPFHSKKILAGLIAMTLVFTAYKEINLKKDIAHHTDQKKWVFMHLVSLDNLYELVDHYRMVCKQQKVKDFAVLDNLWCRNELCYGGPALYKDFPSTLMTLQERRSWRIAEENKRTPARFVLLSPDYDLDKKGFDKKAHFRMARLDDYGCFLIEENTKPLPAFLESIGSPINAIK